MEGYIFDIKRFAVHDGPGIRTTLFMTGCPLDCWWCHNPESRPDTGVLPGKSRKVTDKFVISELKKDFVFYEESGGGVTFSGGEPLYQPRFLLELLRKMKNESFHTALDTTGYASESIIEEVIPFTDLFLYDLKIMDPIKHKEFTGVDNRIILKNLKMIIRRKKNVVIRFPLVPGYNDSSENILEMIEFLKNLENISRVDILPYHKLGISKYKKFNLRSSLEFLLPPSDDKISEVRNMFDRSGFRTGIGG